MSTPQGRHWAKAALLPELWLPGLVLTVHEAPSKVRSAKGHSNRKSSGHIKCSNSQTLHLTPFREVISLAGRVGEERGIVTVTSLWRPAVPLVRAPG